MSAKLEWKDRDGDEFAIDDGAEAEAWLDEGAIACITVTSWTNQSETSVWVDEMDARALITWLQQRLEQSSTAPSSGVILDGQPTDTEPRH